MLVKARLSGLRETRVKEYLTRFVLGGAATLGAALITQKWGPIVGGLFLAFPAIFPASVTIVEAHQKRRKERRKMKGERRARQAIIAEAAGAQIGCTGLASFAVVAWILLPRVTPVLAITTATAAWVVVSVTAWWLLRR